MLPTRTYSFNEIDGSTKHIPAPPPSHTTRTTRRQHFRHHNITAVKQHIAVLHKLNADTEISRAAAYTQHVLSNVADIDAFIEWSAVPHALNPIAYLPHTRYQRKQQQLSNMLCMFSQLVQHVCGNDRRKQLRVVDFCSSSGHMALLIAYLYPHFNVTLIDRNTTAVRQARQRVHQSGLTNVTIVQADILSAGIDDIHFDIAVGLHACGFLTDVIQCRAVQQHAAYLLCSCCVGKIQAQIDTPLQHDTVTLRYPRSKSLRHALAISEYRDLIVASDYSGHDMSSSAQQHRRCKQYIEYDRREYSTEHGYVTWCTQMIPATCSAKHDMIAGYKLDHSHDNR